MLDIVYSLPCLGVERGIKEWKKEDTDGQREGVARAGWRWAKWGRVRMRTSVTVSTIKVKKKKQ